MAVFRKWKNPNVQHCFYVYMHPHHPQQQIIKPLYWLHQVFAQGYTDVAFVKVNLNNWFVD